MTIVVVPLLFEISLELAAAVHTYLFSTHSLISSISVLTATSITVCTAGISHQ